MASLTIRKLEDDVKEGLRLRAAKHGRSMEEEARVILARAVGGITGSGLWELSRQLFSDDDGVTLDSPPRGDDRPPPRF
jgi:plasmid stability protein